MFRTGIGEICYIGLNIICIYMQRQYLKITKESDNAEDIRLEFSSKPKRKHRPLK